MKYNNWALFVALLIGLTTKRIIFSYYDFHYNFIQDPFHLGYLLIDLGVYFTLCYGALFAIMALLPSKNEESK